MKGKEEDIKMYITEIDFGEKPSLQVNFDINEILLCSVIISALHDSLII
jgi:hypothetical protein